MTEVATIDETVKLTKLRLIGAFALVLLSYILAFGAAFGIVIALTGLMHPIWITLIADVGATIVVFIFSLIFNNVSFYDPYWSIQPIIIVIYWMLLPGARSANLIRQIIVICLVSFWGVRLTLNWIRGWKGINHEDWRYNKFRTEKPRILWFIKLKGLQLMKKIIVFIGCLYIYKVAKSKNK